MLWIAANRPSLLPASHRARLAWTSRLALLGLFAWLVVGQSGSAQEVTGLQAAVALENVLVEAIAANEKSVVAIVRGRKAYANQLINPDYVPNEYGTGVVIDPAGLILTNFHVLGEVEQSAYAVWLGGQAYRATIKGADPWSDLAVLQIDANKLQPVKFGDAKGLKRGQIVLTLGNPYAIARDGQPSAGWGMIANLSRKAGPLPDPSKPEGRKETLHHFGTLIQTDARLNLGSSGGALLNLRGEMIGLTTSLAAQVGYEKSAGYAIPVDATFRRIVETLKEGRRVAYGFLGVNPQPLSELQRAQGKRGVILQQIVPGTPAFQAGLRRDDIVTHVEDAPIETPDDLILEVGRLPADQVARLTVDRGGRLLQRDVRLSKKYLVTLRGAIITAEIPSWRGMRIEFATAIPRFLELSGAVDLAGCVAVAEVLPDTQAWKAGLRPGMFVSHVGKQRVSTPDEFYAAVEGRDDEVSLRLSGFQRGTDTLNVAP